MNYYEIMELVKNQIDFATYETLKNDFNDRFNAELRKIQINNTTRKNAIKSYLAHDNIMQDNKYNNQLVFSDGVSVLNIISTPENMKTYEAEKKSDKCADYMLEAFKTMRPTDTPYIWESVAVARALGWTPNTTDYLIEIDGNYYNFSLVYSLWGCIADKNNANSIDCMLCDAGKRKSLLMRSKYGCALLLPVARDALHISKNVGFRAYIDYEKANEDYFINIIKKGA